MLADAANGIATLVGRHSVDQTVETIQRLLQAKSIKLFALIDHSGEAKKAGLTMPNTKLLIFGNAIAGTPLMLASPAAAIDLPLKILVWEGADGKTLLAYNTPEYLQTRHRFSPELIRNIAAVAALANTAANE